MRSCCPISKLAAASKKVLYELDFYGFKFKDVLEFDLELSFHFFQKKSNKSSLPGVYATLNFHNVDESNVLFARGGPRYTHQRGVRVQHARRQCDHRW